MAGPWLDDIYMSNMCTLLLFAWLMAVISYVCIYDVHLPYKSSKYLSRMVYIPSLVGIFFSGTYLAVCEVDGAVGCILTYTVCEKMSGLYANMAGRLCELYLQFGSHICLMIHVKYMYSVSWHVFDGSDFICGI